MSGDEVPFGEFGVVLLREMFTPEFLRARLDAALDSAPRIPGFPGHVSSLSAGMPRLLSGDGAELCFAVTVRARLMVELWPRTLGTGFDASMETDLTVRVRTYRPTIVRLDIDPVTADDLRVRVRGRSDWLPGLLEAGGAGVGKGAKRWLPVLALGLNGALEASVSRRQVDVLAGRERAAGERRGPGHRRTPAGARIGFAEFGEALIAGAVDRDTVLREVDNEIDTAAQVVFDAPMLLRAVVAAKLADVSSVPTDADELRYSLAIDIDVELRLGPGGNATVLATTLRADVPLRVSATVGPATVHLRFEPVPAGNLETVQPLRRSGGRWIPVSLATLAELIPRRVADELNARLARADRQIVIADLV